MKEQETDALFERLQALRRQVDALVIEGVSRRNEKATRAMFVLLDARAVADDFYLALLRERNNTQLARMAYMDAVNGKEPH